MKKSSVAMTKSAAAPPTIPPAMAPTLFLEPLSWSLPSLDGSVAVGKESVVEEPGEGVASGSLPIDSADVALKLFSF